MVKATVQYYFYAEYSTNPVYALLPADSIAYDKFAFNV